MSGYISNPSLTDIQQISQCLASLKSLSQLLAYLLWGLFVALEVLNQNLRIAAGRSELMESSVRFFLIFLGLLLYDKIFNGIVTASFGMNMAVLAEDKWAEFLYQLSHYFQSNSISIFSGLSIVATWVGSYLAVLSSELLGWLQYCLLALLYFLGPLMFVCYVYKPISHITGTWFRLVVELCLWSFLIRVVVRVMLELQMQTNLTNANTNKNLLEISGIVMTFVIMVFLTPLFASVLLNRRGLAAVGVWTTELTNHLTVSSINKIVQWAQPKQSAGPPPSRHILPSVRPPKSPERSS